MKIYTTGLIPENVVSGVFQSLGNDVDLEQPFVSRRSAESSIPEVLVFLAELDEWLSPFRKAFLAVLGKHAADEFWTNKKAIGEFLKSKSAGAFGRLCESIQKALFDCSENATVRIGLCLPDDYFGTTIGFSKDDAEHIPWFVACFLESAEKIADLISEHEGEIVGMANLTLLDDCSFVVSWMDKDSLDIVEFTIPGT